MKYILQAAILIIGFMACVMNSPRQEPIRCAEVVNHAYSNF